MYHIAGNFQGRKLLWISRFCGYLRKFSPQNFWVWCLLVRQNKAIHEIFLRKNCIFHHSRKFSPSKVSAIRYMYVCLFAWTDQLMVCHLAPLSMLVGNRKCHYSWGRCTMTLTNMHSTSDLCIVTSLYESAFWGIVNYCFMHVPVHEQLVNPSKKTDIDDVCLLLCSI